MEEEEYDETEALTVSVDDSEDVVSCARVWVAFEVADRVVPASDRGGKQGCSPARNSASGQDAYGTDIRYCCAQWILSSKGMRAQVLGREI